MYRLPSSKGASRLGNDFFIPGSSLSQRLSRLSNSYQLPGILNIKQTSRSSRATPLIRYGGEARVIAEPAGTGKLQPTPAPGTAQPGSPRSTHRVGVQPGRRFRHHRAPSEDTVPFLVYLCSLAFPTGRGLLARRRLPQPRCCSVTRDQQDEAAEKPREPPRHRITRCSPAHPAPAGRGCSSLRL